MKSSMKKYLLLFLIWTVGLFADAVLVTVGRGTPQIDGQLQDAVWQDSIACGPFLLDGLNRFAEQQTTVRFLWDDDNLYVAFECQEGVLDPIQNRLHDFKNGFSGEESDQVYSTDMVELLLGNRLNGTMYDVVVAASGVVCDCVSSLDSEEYWSRRDRSWQSGAVVSIGVDNRHLASHWVAEIALPWSSLGGCPLMGERWSFLATRREVASKEASSLQTVTGGIHDRRNQGELFFGEAVPGVLVSSFPAFLPGGNVLKISKTNALPATLKGKVSFGNEDILLEQECGEAIGELPFTLERTGDFGFSWSLAQGDVIYYRSPEYQCRVNTSVLTARLENAELAVNGVAVDAEGSLPLQAGGNELTVKASADATVALEAGGIAIPYPEGWVREDGVDRLTILSEASLVWPNWQVEGIFLNRGGLQQILYFPQGIPGKAVSDYTMTFELPAGIRMVGASGYYKLFPLEVKEQGSVWRNGVEFTKYAITVRKKLSYQAMRKSHEMIAVLIEIDEAIALNETSIYYYASSQEANALELPNRFAAHVIEAAKGVQPQEALIEMWGSWLGSMDDNALKHRIFDYMADAGVNEINCAVGDYERLRPFTLFNFEDWNFNCQPYLQEHPEQAQVGYDGKVGKGIVCSTHMVRNPQFAAFLKSQMKDWHERRGLVRHIDWDYESHVKDSYMSCYCPLCIADFAKFAGISPEGLTSERINQEHLSQWQKYCHRRVADFARLLGQTIHEELPGVVFSIYSGYQSERSKLVYGIDWSLLEGILDFAMCGYGRSAEQLAATQACFQKTKLVLGELVFPFDTTQRIAPQTVRAATLLRRCCDATKGCLMFQYPELDGRSFLAIAEVSRIVANYEAFFTTGLRAPQMLETTTMAPADYEVLGDGEGNYLVVLMNQKDQPREFVFEVGLPLGRRLLDEEGREVAPSVSTTLAGSAVKVYLIR